MPKNVLLAGDFGDSRRHPPLEAMIHPHTELRFINQELGYGVFATQLIPLGTITWVRDSLDQVIAPDRLHWLPPPYRELLDKYTFRDEEGRHILCWDLGRFMNHSCAPSCLGPSGDFEIAVRDIQPGEELTDDYASLFLQSHESFACHCRSVGCRRHISPADASKQTAVWEALLQPAMKFLSTVEQPLGPLLEARGLDQFTSAGSLRSFAR